MDEQTESFDPYDEWLEIPPEDQPPTFYRLLGLEDFQADTAIIDEAAKRRTAFLHQIASGPNRKVVQRLLSEVATARRTLLSDDAKHAYDQSLQDRDADEVVGPMIQVVTPDAATSPTRSGANRTSTRDRGGTRRRRKKKSWLDDWRVHAVSASALLFVAIVAVIVSKYSDGGRRASRPDAMGGPANSMEAAARANARTTSAAQARSRAGGRTLTTSGKSTPPNKRRSLLGDPLPPAQSVASPSGKNENSSATVTLDLGKGDWLASLKSVEDFSDTFVDRFRVMEGDEQRFKMEAGKLNLNPASGDPKPVTLMSNSIVMRPGETVAVDSNMRKGLPGSVRVGLAIGKLRLRIDSVPEKKLPIRVAGHNGDLGLLTTGNSKITLVIMRDAENPDSFQWVAVSGAKNVSGRLKMADLAGIDEAPVGIFFSCPSEGFKGKLWISNLRAGKLADPPDLKKPVETTIES